VYFGNKFLDIDGLTIYQSSLPHNNSLLLMVIQSCYGDSATELLKLLLIFSEYFMYLYLILLSEIQVTARHIQMAPYWLDYPYFVSVMEKKFCNTGTWHLVSDM
jgi:hypothetical protein